MEAILERRTVTQAVPLLLKLPMGRFWVDYDQEADVLYISLRRPQHATDTQMAEDGILLQYHGDDLVGITVLGLPRASEAPPSSPGEARPSALPMKRPAKRKAAASPRRPVRPQGG